MTGGWTDEDGEIMTAMARRIVNATVKAQTIPPRDTEKLPGQGLGTYWPERAYMPSQAWAATLNI